MNEAPPATLVDLVRELMTHTEETADRYAANQVSGLRTHPIPFFGNLPEADVLTVGLNPSAGEFADGRGWPAALDAATLTRRLVHYFDASDRPAHPWFARWEEALAPLGASYRAGARLRAAHLDLSPRATVSAAAVPDIPLFERMIADDLPWALRFLVAAQRVRLLLMAGSVSKRYYLNMFIARYLPEAAGRLEGPTRLPAGRGVAVWHTLAADGRRLPVYFCSSSPSDRRTPTLLRDRLAADAPTLLERLA